MGLKADIDKYIRTSLQQLKVTEAIYKKMNLSDAVIRSASARTTLDKIDSHQRRIGKVLLTKASNELMMKINLIRKCKTFADIFEITESVKKAIYGLGDLWSYDTALRIGFNMDIYPKDVYVQAGVRKGVTKIFTQKRIKGRCFPLSIFPSEIQKLKPHEVENFLCVWGKSSSKAFC